MPEQQQEGQQEDHNNKNAAAVGRPPRRSRPSTAATTPICRLQQQEPASTVNAVDEDDADVAIVVRELLQLRALEAQIDPAVVSQQERDANAATASDTLSRRATPGTTAPRSSRTAPSKATSSSSSSSSTTGKRRAPASLRSSSSNPTSTAATTPSTDPEGANQNHLWFEDYAVEKRPHFVSSCRAMHDIVSLKLHRHTGHNLENYFKTVWRVSRAQSYRFLDCGYVLKCLEHTFPIADLPYRERVCRTLKLLTTSPAQIRFLWRHVLQEASSNCSRSAGNGANGTTTATRSPITSTFIRSVRANLASSGVWAAEFPDPPQVSSSPPSSSASKSSPSKSERRPPVTTTRHRRRSNIRDVDITDTSARIPENKADDADITRGPATVVIDNSAAISNDPELGAFASPSRVAPEAISTSTTPVFKSDEDDTITVTPPPMTASTTTTTTTIATAAADDTSIAIDILSPLLHDMLNAFRSTTDTTTTAPRDVVDDNIDLLDEAFFFTEPPQPPSVIVPTTPRASTETSNTAQFLIDSIVNPSSSVSHPPTPTPNPTTIMNHHHQQKQHHHHQQHQMNVLSPSQQHPATPMPTPMCLTPIDTLATPVPTPILHTDTTSHWIASQLQIPPTPQIPIVNHQQQQQQQQLMHPSAAAVNRAILLSYYQTQLAHFPLLLQNPQPPQPPQPQYTGTKRPHPGSSSLDHETGAKRLAMGLDGAAGLFCVPALGSAAAGYNTLSGGLSERGGGGDGGRTMRLGFEPQRGASASSNIFFF